MSAERQADLPAPLRFRHDLPGDVAEYTQFVLTMSAELKVAIDQYLLGWVCRFEPTAPGYLPQPENTALSVAPSRPMGHHRPPQPIRQARHPDSTR